MKRFIPILILCVIGCNGIVLPPPEDVFPPDMIPDEIVIPDDIDDGFIFPPTPTPAPIPGPTPTPAPEPTPKPEPGSYAEIVMVSARGCFWCRKQAEELYRHETEYNIRYIKAAEDIDLMIKWKIDPIFPTLLIVEDGKVVEKWIGFTPWPEIEKVADKARK